MATINAKQYSSPRNINLKDGILRFAATQSSNPLDSSSNGIYVNSSNQLIFSAQGTLTVLGTTGGAGSVPSWDAIFQGDQTMQLGGLSTYTIDRNSGNNDVLTITNTGAGTGDCIQITNAGTGNDIEGSSDTWHFTVTGDMTANTVVFAGDAGSSSLTLTAGDVLVSDGSVAITDADNAATFSITNNTATAAAVIVLAGSGAFTGSTTTSFLTLTPSGLTSGTAAYIVGAALTTGKLIHVVGDAVSSGILVHIASSAAGTQLTTTGRLLKVDHTGAATGTGIVAEVNSAAADETDIFKVTASAGLTGGALVVSVSSLATGTAIEAADLDSLTTGLGVHIASAATAIATTGRLLYVNHTGTTSTSGILTEFITSATDETTVVKITTAAMIDGVALSVVGTTGMTTGSLIRATSSTAGAVATNGVYAFGLTGAFTSTADTLGAFHIAGASTLTGTIMSILGGAHTSGIALHITDPSTGMTSGSLLRIATATTGAVATKGIVSISATGAYTSTSNAGLVDIIASGTTAGTVVRIRASAAGQTATQLLNVTASGYTTGYTGNVVQITGVSTTGASNTLAIISANTTAGNAVSIACAGLSSGTGLYISAVEATLTTGLYIQCYDGAANDFSVGRYGATIIAGTAALTASLTLTKGDFLMSDGVIRGATTATITADAGSIQGGNPITKSFNEISVCGVSGDSITLPSAATGQYVLVTNHGAQSADVFPALGDAINEAAANTAKALAADASLMCYAYDATNWECLTMAR